MARVTIQDFLISNAKQVLQQHQQYQITFTLCISQFYFCIEHILFSFASDFFLFLQLDFSVL